MGSNPAAPTKRRMLKGTRLFLRPQERVPQTQRTQRNQRFQRFHGALRKPRNQRFQRNHDFTIPPENHEINDFNEITISRYPNGITKATISTKSRFHDTPRKARFQRNQRNHDFTAPQRNHESNETHEKNETPGKKAFRCFRCVCINRDFVGNVGQARPKGAHTQYPKPPPLSLQICAKSRKSARGAFPSLQSGRGVLQCKALSLHHFITA